MAPHHSDWDCGEDEDEMEKYADEYTDEVIDQLTMAMMEQCEISDQWLSKQHGVTDPAILFKQLKHLCVCIPSVARTVHSLYDDFRFNAETGNVYGEFGLPLDVWCEWSDILAAHRSSWMDMTPGDDDGDINDLSAYDSVPREVRDSCGVTDICGAPVQEHVSASAANAPNTVVGASLDFVTAQSACERTAATAFGVSNGISSTSRADLKCPSKSLVSAPVQENTVVGASLNPVQDHVVADVCVAATVHDKVADLSVCGTYTVYHKVADFSTVNAPVIVAGGCLDSLFTQPAHSFVHPTSVHMTATDAFNFCLAQLAHACTAAICCGVDALTSQSDLESQPLSQFHLALRPAPEPPPTSTGGSFGEEAFTNRSGDRPEPERDKLHSCRWICFYVLFDFYSVTLNNGDCVLTLTRLLLLGLFTPQSSGPERNGIDVELMGNVFGDDVLYSLSRSLQCEPYFFHRSLEVCLHQERGKATVILDSALCFREYYCWCNRQAVRKSARTK